MTFGNHFLLAQAELARPHAVDVEFQRRLVQILRNENVRDTGDLADFSRQIERELIVGLQVGAGDLDVDRGRQTHVQRRFDQTARAKYGVSCGSSCCIACFTRAMYS